MREIKFRVFISDTEGLIYSEEYQSLLLFFLDIGIFREKVEQYIGLPDKNGKDMYEGDKIRTPNGKWGIIVRKGHCFEVSVSETESCFYSADWMMSCEVIGHRRENKEQLK